MATLARRFIAAGLAGDEHVAAAVDDPEPSLAEALAVAAGVGADAARGLAEAHALDAVFELLRWPSGHFAFAATEVGTGVVDAGLAAAEVIAEAQRRLEGWAELTRRLPGPDTVLAAGLSSADSVEVSSEEWSVLRLLDGRRTLAQAVSLSEHGEWRTLTVIAGLVDRGLLVESDDAGSVGHRALLVERLDGAAPAATPPAASEPFLDEQPETEAHHDADGVGEPTDAPQAVEPATAASAFAAAQPPVVPAEVAAVPAQPTAPDPAAEHAAPAGEPDGPAVADEPAAASDGVDDVLLQRLIAGVRAL